MFPRPAQAGASEFQGAVSYWLGSFSEHWDAHASIQLADGQVRYDGGRVGSGAAGRPGGERSSTLPLAQGMLAAGRAFGSKPFYGGALFNPYAPEFAQAAVAAAVVGTAAVTARQRRGSKDGSSNSQSETQSGMIPRAAFPPVAAAPGATSAQDGAAAAAAAPYEQHPNAPDGRRGSAAGRPPRVPSSRAAPAQPTPAIPSSYTTGATQAGPSAVLDEQAQGGAAAACQQQEQQGGQQEQEQGGQQRVQGARGRKRTAPAVEGLEDADWDAGGNADVGSDHDAGELSADTTVRVSASRRAAAQPTPACRHDSHALSQLLSASPGMANHSQEPCTTCSGGSTKRSHADSGAAASTVPNPIPPVPLIPPVAPPHVSHTPHLAPQPPTMSQQPSEGLKAIIRRQANREAARRSRMRKAAEAEEGERRRQQTEARMAALQEENAALRQQLQEALERAGRLAREREVLAAEVVRLGGSVPAGGV